MTLTKRQWWRIGLLAVAVIGMGWVILNIFSAMTPFIIGLILAVLLVPLVDWLNRFMPRVLAVGLIFILVFGLLALFLIYVIPILVEQGQRFVKDIPGYVQSFQNWLGRTQSNLQNQIPDNFQDTFNKAVSDFGTNALNFGRSALGSILDNTFALVSGTASFVLGFVLATVWLFFVLRDKQKHLDRFYDIIPANQREDTRRILNITRHDLFKYVQAFLIDAAIVGSLITLGLILILGFPISTAIFLGFLSAIFQLVPTIGPIVATVPAGVVAFFTGGVGNFDLVIKVVILYLVVQQLDGNVIMPKIAGDNTAFSPAAILMLVVAGSALAGIVGAIVAVPVAAIVRDLYVYIYQRRVLEANPDEAEGQVPGRKQEIQKALGQKNPPPKSPSDSDLPEDQAKTDQPEPAAQPK